MNPKIVFFDLGLTLVDSGHAEAYRKSLSQIQTDLPETDARLAYHLALKDCMREEAASGNSVWKEFPKKFLGHANISMTEKTFQQWVPVLQVALSECRWKAFPFSLQVLDELRGMGIRTGLISNWDMTCRKVLEENRLAERLDPIIVSSECGSEKPDVRIFEAALQDSGFAPEQCLYVGDNYYNDVIGAEKACIHTILLNPYGRKGIEELSYDDVAEDIREIPERMEKTI
ncbi:MAG: HAD family hydrolase [Solobacterium sp.]|jgi:putative hydrolase of the HAD superfamily|nr:HAD family hydrolase [Solobacterium sp.]